ncbi:MAG: threonine synthase [Tannerellaceae bacterium]|jgi:threonine synthase|nr:threonine synthase [Tannerellaceae bacterium]
MKYYSTNKEAPLASLKKAVIKGLAGDRGLYMPENIDLMKDFVIGEMKNMSFREIACTVSDALFGDDVDKDMLHQIVAETLTFDTPIVPLGEQTYSLELFHGPTLAFKDIGARFMARLLAYFIEREGVKNVNVLVATSGDTGSAVANGFLGLEGIRVYVLYPKGKVSAIQEAQFTTLGRNITALEIDGTFDDCQALVKAAFMDEEMNEHSKLTSANSINVARFLPQSFYYFYAYAQLDRIGQADQLLISVPSGNLGNLSAGLFAHWMGLPVKRFLAANNRNDVFYHYLKTGRYTPRPALPSCANAMDVGDPSNFARILDLFSIYPNPYASICKRIAGYRYSDREIAATIRRAYEQYGYILDPHGACGYQALIDEATRQGKKTTGLFLETAHPAKFKDTVEAILGINIELPARIQAFMEGEKQSIPLGRDFAGFKKYFLNR